jgi:hypothetical protein
VPHTAGESSKHGVPYQIVSHNEQEEFPTPLTYEFPESVPLDDEGTVDNGMLVESEE